MNKCKYVVLDYMGTDTMFIFPNYIKHSDFVGSMRLGSDRVISAGFINCDPRNDVFEAYGDSFSLNVKSRPEDTKLLRRLLGVNEYEW